MKRLFITIILAGSIGFATTATAQLRKIPAEVTNAFAEKYDDAKNVEWKDVVKAFAATFEADGAKQVAKFNKKGGWISTEREIEEADLPEDVKDGLSKSKYADWEVRAYYHVSIPEDKVQYRIHVAKSDIQQKNLLFDNTGKLLKDNLTL